MRRQERALIRRSSAVGALPERLNNIPEAQMKHFLHSGCLLRSVFEVELKMSSFLYHSSVPGGRRRGRRRGQAGREREKKIVIQIEEARGRLKKKKKTGVGADRRDPRGAFFPLPLRCYNLRQDIASRLICRLSYFCGVIS